MIKLLFRRLYFLIFVFIRISFLDIRFIFLLLSLALSIYGFSGLEYKILGNGFWLDSISMNLILLTILVTVLIIIASHSVFKISLNRREFYFLVISLFIILLLRFSVSNYLQYYFFFEASLIPTLLIILGWGYQPERLQAGLYFLFYTLFISLPLLLCIIYSLQILSTLEIVFSINNDILLSNFSLYFRLFLIFAFLVKMPIYFTHLWLPKAHVEAPVAGSIILAGVLLKLGGYGIARVMRLIIFSVSKIRRYFIGLSLVGIICVGFMCCRLNDIKALVAYSSVAHMALVIRGLFRYFIWGFAGILILIISHGVASSGLFCIVNIYYERISSRSIYLNKGLIVFLPIYSLFIFMLRAANIAAPPTINLMSEVILITSILGIRSLILIIFPLGSFIGAAYSLFIFSYTQHGRVYNRVNSFYTFSYREIYLLFIHVFIVYIVILKSDYLFSFYSNSLN